MFSGCDSWVGVGLTAVFPAYCKTLEFLLWGISLGLLLCGVGIWLGCVVVEDCDALGSYFVKCDGIGMMPPLP